METERDFLPLHFLYFSPFPLFPFNSSHFPLNLAHLSRGSLTTCVGLQRSAIYLPLTIYQTYSHQTLMHVVPIRAALVIIVDPRSGKFSLFAEQNVTHVSDPHPPTHGNRVSSALLLVQISSQCGRSICHITTIKSSQQIQQQKNVFIEIRFILGPCLTQYFVSSIAFEQIDHKKRM